MNLEDIAKRAGVSRGTVSRVINNAPDVSARTREHVWKVIRQENYQPNPAARALVRNRTEIIGVVIPTNENIFFTDNNYFTQILAGISPVICQRDYAMLLWVGELTEEDLLRRKISNSRLTDGMIISSMMYNHPLAKRLLSLRNPFVMIDRPLQHESWFNYVTVDNVRAAEEATTHLIRLGRRRIAHITGDLDIADAQDRLQGYKNALIQAGREVQPELIAEAHFNRQAGYEATRRLLPHKPDAIFAACDTMAVGVLKAAREAGVRVPDDLAVVGFDDVDVASHSFPSLTTVRQPVQEKGAAAAELLIDLLEKRVEGPQRVLLRTDLVIRESCGAIAH